MRTPRQSRVGLLGLVAVGAAAFLLLGAGGSGGVTPVEAGGSWLGLVGADRPDVTIGQRVIVVLKAPSLAQRVAAAGGIASTVDERIWTDAAYAAQRQLITSLAIQGIGIRPEFSFARVLDGFSAALDPRAIAILERSDQVAGIYPVRAAFPASVSASVLHGAAFGPDSGHRAGVQLPGHDGRGVTIALLDTGVDRAQPYLRGRVLPGIDVVGGADGAVAAADPADPSRLETHGTELAGLLVGSGGPSGLAGVATGALVLPIRVAGWQTDGRGGEAVYARSDQLIAGLERAVDPNDDGDAHDAARVALLGLAERYAAFTDSPEARAVQGALDLDTLVVAPAGNDGAGGPGFGSLAGPGGAPAALTVGAADTRASLDRVRVVLRRGLDVLYDREVPLLGAVAPGHALDLPPAEPRARTPQLTDFFDLQGFSLVAGKAALVAAGDDPVAEAEQAAQSGAAAVVLFGGSLPAGSLGLDEEVGVPVVGIPAGPALALLGARTLGADVEVAIGPARSRPNPSRDRVAAFSSSGLAFDARVKPDVVAPGVELATSQPGTTADGSARYATVTGSSGAAAVTAGAAALLAQVRPGLGAAALESLLVGSAAPVAGDSVTAQGAGLLDVGAAAAAELTAAPTSLALGAWTGAGWSAKQTIVVSNVSTRRLAVGVTARPEGGESEVLAVELDPARLVLRPGRSRTVTVTFHLAAPPVGDLGAGSIELRPDGGQALRIPWAIDYRPPSTSLIGAVSLSTASFAPSDTAPVRLAVRAGAVLRRGGLFELRPVARLDVQLWRADGTGLGLLARLRDLLPGRYTFGLTGRDPEGKTLPPGAYKVRLVAWPTTIGPPSVRSMSFTVK